MLSKKMLFIPQYINWLFKNYRILKKMDDFQDAYRISDIQKNKYGQTILTIQIIGKNTIFKATPEEITKNELMVNGFSRSDVCTITYLTCQHHSKPKFKIRLQKFCSKINKIVFLIEKRYGGLCKEKTANEVSINKEMLQALSQEDAHLIGYTTATEQMLIEKDILNELNINHSEHR